MEKKQKVEKSRKSEKVGNQREKKSEKVIKNKQKWEMKKMEMKKVGNQIMKEI